MTPIEIAAAIQAGKAAFDTIRGMAEAVNKSENAAEAVQITSAMAELGARVTEMQSAIFGLAHENEALRDELRKRDEDSRLAEQLRFEEGVLWRYRAESDREPDPYCPLCFERDKALVHLKRHKQGDYFCEIHTTSYKTKEYVAPAPRNPARGNWRG